ncbi:helix-turn-helix domain-containing protein [Roseibium salinum]|uniref:Helix-turn-helix domain-containing protein n=1 Tax=Roseibium salinum TaxID=1604349 RepID=A0ABT3QV43_9HYPH|nr:helix-turn-helix domain-containing protein [Roseibium sp. DSM 29163]MCX2720810.1 helix-turn-helix domain-containing protein [Roseibium sp. DSM 29163]MDN3722728.1 helix-turn-helix domain-containing protein [Roseibium salinum]
MTESRTSKLPEVISIATAQGTSVIRAYREHLGYSLDELAAACGLTVDEIRCLEEGHRFEKGYRDRIARALSLPVGTFDVVPDTQDAELVCDRRAP